METKHTPGPWQIGGSLVSNTDGCEIALLRHDGYDRRAPSIAEHDANARLIAAAPELLHVAELARDLIANIEENDDLTEYEQRLIDAARDAIAKATEGAS